MKESIKCILCYLLSMVLFVGNIPVYAGSNIVVDKNAAKNNQAKLDKTKDGVTIVNISGNLSKAGVSHNKFTAFDLDTEGTIINNATEFSVSRLTGDTIYNNPLLQSSAAKVILTEVTGGNKSTLVGYTEILGNRADYIFANPSGITCNGCGFINVDRLSMITGSSNISGGELNGFNLGSGKLTIAGNGLDGSGTNAVDLVTRIAEITGSIFAGNELNIKTGNDYYDYLTRQVNSDNSVSNNTDQGGALFGVDASEFGSMYAGKIAIIATEAGFGVRSDADMVASVNDLMITADGDIEYKNIASSGDIKLVSGQDIKQNGYVYSNSNFVAESGHDIRVAGDFLYADSVALSAEQDITIDNNLYGVNSVDITGQNVESKIIYTAGSSNIIADNFINHEVLQAERGLNITANDITNKGVILSNSALTVSADLLTNEGKLLALGDSDIAASNITNNTGKILLLGNENIISANSFDNSNTRDLATNELDRGLIVTGNLSADIGLLDNSAGNIYLGGVSDIGAVKNNAGFLHIASGNIGDETKLFENKGGEIEIGNQGYVGIRASSIDGEGGIINGYGSLSVLAGTTEFSLSGDIAVAGLFTLSHYLALAEEESASNTFLSVINNGNIYGEEGMYITGGAVTNNGNLISDYDIGFNVAAEVANNGGIYAANDFYSESGSFVNKAEIISGRDMVIKAVGGLDNMALDEAGNIAAGRDFIFDGKILDNQNGSVIAYGETYVKNLKNGNGYFYSGSGGIIDNTQMQYEDLGVSFRDDDGNVMPEYFTTIKYDYDNCMECGEYTRNPGGAWEVPALEWLGTGMLYNRGGVIETGSGLLTLQAATIDYNDGAKITGDGSIAIEVSRENRDPGGNIYGATHRIEGEISVGGEVSVAHSAGGDLSIVNTGKVYGKEGVFINSSALNNYGELLSATNVNIDTEYINNSTEGKIYSEGDIFITGGRLLNRNGAEIISEGNMSIIAMNGVSNWIGSHIVSGGDMLLSGNRLDNEDYIRSSGGMSLLFDDLVRNRSEINSHEAKILSYGDLTVMARDGGNVKTVENIWSRISAKGDMLLAADDLKNEGRDFTSGEVSVTGGVVRSNVFTDLAEILAGGSMLITGSNITNLAGRIYANNSLIQDVSGVVTSDYLDEYSKVISGTSYNYVSNDATEIIAGSHEGYLANFEATHYGSESLVTILPINPGAGLGEVNPGGGLEGGIIAPEGNGILPGVTITPPDISGYQDNLVVLTKGFNDFKVQMSEIKNQATNDTAVVEPIGPDNRGELFNQDAITYYAQIDQILTESGIKFEDREDDYLADEIFKTGVIEDFTNSSYREYSDAEKAIIEEQIRQQEAYRNAASNKALVKNLAKFNNEIELAEFSRSNFARSNSSYSQYSYVPVDLDNIFSGFGEGGLIINASKISGGSKLAANNGDVSLIAAEDIKLKDAEITSSGKLSLIAGDDISVTKTGRVKHFFKDAKQAVSTAFNLGLDAANSLIEGLAFNADSDIQIAAGGDLTIETDYLNSGGSIYLETTGDFTNNNHEINATDDVVIEAENIYNKHIDGGAATKIIAGDVAYLKANSAIENTGATIAAGNLAYLEAGGNIKNKSNIVTTKTGSNVTTKLTNKGAITSDNMLVLNAGGNILNEAADITAGGDMNIIAGGDIDIKTKELYNRDYDRFSGGYSDTKTWTHEASNITSGGDMGMLSGGLVNIEGSKLSAGGDLDIAAADGIDIGAAEDKSNYRYHWQGKKKWGSRKYVDKWKNTTTLVQSELTGSNINIDNSGAGDIDLTAAKILADNTINLATANGDINIINGYNSEYEEEITKKTAGWAGAAIGVAAGFATGGASLLVSGLAGQAFANNDKEKKTETKTKYSVVATELTAGSDVNINGSEDVNITASNIQSTSGDVNIESSNDINLKIAKDIASHSVVEEKESLMWFNNHDRGSYDETIRQNTITADNGSVNLLAQNDINIEKKLAEDDIVFDHMSGNINYTETEELHEEWNEETEGLTEVGAAVVAVAAAVVTGGAASGFAGAIGSAAGAGATAAGVGSGVASAISVGVTAGVTAGASAAASQVAVSTVNNKGDLGQVADDLDQGEFYESVLVSAAVAGVTAGANAGADSLNLLSNGDISTSVRDSVISSAVESSIRGDSFSESLEYAMLNAAVSEVSKYGAEEIGQAYKEGSINKAVQLTLHAGLGCASGQATSGSCAGGAAGAVAGEILAESSYNAGYNRETSLAVAEIGSAIAGGIAGGDSDSVYAGSRAGRSSAENNALGLVPLVIGGYTVLSMKGEGSAVKGAQEVYDEASYLANNFHSFSDAEIRNDFVMEGVDNAIILYNNYDYNIGVQANLLGVSGSYGTDGRSMIFNSNPMLGIEFYANAMPINANPVTSVSRSNIGNVKYLSISEVTTSSMDIGINTSIGFNFSLFPVPYNANAIITDKLMK